MNPLTLHALNISKHFGKKRVFDNVTLKHSEGILGIAGPNGSGKSTLLQCFAGLMRPTLGHIDWYKKGQKMETSKIKTKLGYAAPYINLYEELSCIENLAFLMQLRCMPTSSESIRKILKRTDIYPLANQLFGHLSTGQQQRLRLAAAIMHHPEILFLDEPGANLDENGRELVDSLASEFKAKGKLVILASNNPEELALCDTIFSLGKETLSVPE